MPDDRVDAVALELVTQLRHVHHLVPGGTWEAATGTWRSANRHYLFGKDALARAFQARYIRRLQALRRAHRLRFDGPDAAWNTLMHDRWKTPWIVHPKATARNPERSLDYLGRYTHRVAVGDHSCRRSGLPMVPESCRFRRRIILRIDLHPVLRIRSSLYGKLALSLNVPQLPHPNSIAASSFLRLLPTAFYPSSGEDLALIASIRGSILAGQGIKHHSFAYKKKERRNYHVPE